MQLLRFNIFEKMIADDAASVLVVAVDCDTKEKMMIMRAQCLRKEGYYSIVVLVSAKTAMRDYCELLCSLFREHYYFYYDSKAYDPFPY